MVPFIRFCRPFVVSAFVIDCRGEFRPSEAESLLSCDKSNQKHTRGLRPPGPPGLTGAAGSRFLPRRRIARRNDLIFHCSRPTGACIAPVQRLFHRAAAPAALPASHSAYSVSPGSCCVLSQTVATLLSNTPLSTLQYTAFPRTMQYFFRRRLLIRR